MGCKLVVHFIVCSFSSLSGFFCATRGVFVFFHLFRSHFTSFLIAALDTRSWLRRSNVPGTV
ncbi:hypothetical protein COCVIDRAFT_35372 [Bipolaris victoriae FI3]|uniref:Uncharacterized protein n=2 Tax=Bipolaris TaxID=33194 RepID=W6Y2R4_COCC2|nr:uncharacterized protein COCCADRAFT_40273 [Bipolaris zeicola 26-R-13]XP_014559349.1 hypothetical protein COCVIDRAFT_35372 [Bipolaris victoriae FI3]EUC29344.1 hypothetical protein COCCADRAFT_40273 [Bipolaris zeicola 26-R-13]